MAKKRFSPSTSEPGRCPTCKDVHDREVVTAKFEPSADATDGQLADYMMQVETVGDNWTHEVEVTWCPTARHPGRALFGSSPSGCVPTSSEEAGDDRAR